MQSISIAHNKVYLIRVPVQTSDAQTSDATNVGQYKRRTHKRRTHKRRTSTNVGLVQTSD